MNFERATKPWASPSFRWTRAPRLGSKQSRRKQLRCKTTDLRDAGRVFSHKSPKSREHFVAECNGLLPHCQFEVQNVRRELQPMAKRRFIDNRPLTYEQGLTALIVMGVGLTTGAIFTTCFMALSSSPAATWRELWLSGQLNF